MKKTILITMLAMCGLMFVHSQESGSVIDVEGIKKNLAKSDADILTEKKSDPKTWIKRASLYIEASEVYSKKLLNGMNAFTIKAAIGAPKEHNSISKDGENYEEMVYEGITCYLNKGILESWVETNPVNEKSLDIAYEALQKASETDIEKKNEKKIKKTYEDLMDALKRQAANEFVNENYEKCFKYFDMSSEISMLSIVGLVDTANYYNTLLAAYFGKLSDDLILKYAKLCFDNNYKSQKSYIYIMVDTYKSKGDTATALTIMQDVMKNDPGNIDILGRLIETYASMNKFDEAMKYLQMIKEGDPENTIYLFVEGNLYEKMEKIDDAIASYNKILEIKPKDASAYSRIGAIYYDKALDYYIMVNDAKDNTEADKYKAMYKDELKNAEGFFLKALDNAEDNEDGKQTKKISLEILKHIYIRLQMPEEKAKIEEQLQNM